MMAWMPIISLLAGVLGWVGVKFLFDPLRELADLRAEMQELLVLYGNLPADAPGELRSEAGQGFRRVGSKLAARHLSSWWWVQRFYEGTLRLDVYSAGEAAMGLGKAIIELGYAKPNLGSFVPVIRERLRLPVPRPTRAFLELMEELGKPAEFDVETEA